MYYSRHYGVLTVISRAGRCEPEQRGQRRRIQLITPDVARLAQSDRASDSYECGLIVRDYLKAASSTLAVGYVFSLSLSLLFLWHGIMLQFDKVG